MTVVALLSFIIIGLMATFSGTQRAWKTSMTQTDVLEAGRMATDLVTRDFNGLTPCYLPGVTNFCVLDELNPATILRQDFPQTPPPPPPETQLQLKQRVFFLTQRGKVWRTIGYRVLYPETGAADSPVGTLYRYESTNTPVTAPAVYSSEARFLIENPTNNGTLLTPIIDGVVKFVVRVYDTNGFQITTNLMAPTNLGGLYGFFDPRIKQPIPPHGNILFKNALPWSPPDVSAVSFTSNAVPAYADLELGILESQIAERARSMPNATVRSNYLSQQLGAVHIFRQRIPIRNVDPEAYR